MVSIREIRRIFSTVAPERQLTPEAMEEIQNRASMLIAQLAKVSNEIADLETKKCRLKGQHVQRAFLIMMNYITLERKIMNEQNDEETETKSLNMDEVMNKWTEGIRQNTLPIESILVLERIFRFLINDYGPVIVSTICSNELQLFEQMTGKATTDAIPEIQTEEE